MTRRVRHPRDAVAPIGARRALTGHRIGESHPRAKLPDREVAMIRELHEQHGLGAKRIHRIFEGEVGLTTIKHYIRYERR